MDIVLEINNLHKRFGKLTAVQDLSFTVEKGNIYGILGPNGSGKSTTLGIILSVVNPTKGSWKWFNDSNTSKALKRIGAIIERPNFFPHLTAYQNLEIVAKIKEVPKEKIAEKLAIVGLLERKNDTFKSFSLGMKQRLAIAGALLNDPEVLILDEPTNGLDPQGIIQIRELIQQIAADGTTILLASHLLDEVEKVCSHVVILERGKTVFCGPVKDMAGTAGYLELAANDNEKLKEYLNELPYILKISQDTGFIRAFLSEDINPALLNKHLMEKGIALSHLAKKSDTLEQKFLKLTNNDRA